MDFLKLSNIEILQHPDLQIEIDILNAENQRRHFDQQLPDWLIREQELLNIVNAELDQNDLFWKFWRIEQQHQRDMQYLFWSKKFCCECVNG